MNYFLSQQELLDIFVPYEDGSAHSRVMGNTNVIKVENHESGIYYRIRVPDFIFNQLGLKKYILSDESPIQK